MPVFVLYLQYTTMCNKLKQLRDFDRLFELVLHFDCDQNAKII